MKICTKCKQPIEDGKLFCGYCGGLGEETVFAPAVEPQAAPANGEMILSPFPGRIKNLLVAEGASVKKDQPILVLEAMKMDNDITAPCDGIVSFQVVKGQNVVLKNKVLAVIDTEGKREPIEQQEENNKEKLVDMDEWKKASPIRELLSNPKIPRIFTILNILGTIILIAVGIALFLSAIDTLKNEALSETIMLAKARIKFDKLIKTVFIGGLVLYIVFSLPYVELYLLISRRNFIKKRLEQVKAEELETESHAECLERLCDSNETLGNAHAYLLARDEMKFGKEMFCSLVTVAGKILSIVFAFVFLSGLFDKILVPNPSLDITYFLTQPTLWGFLVCVITDIFIPNFRDMTLVSEELEKAEIKLKVARKKK